jgi:hypothetical protein
MSRFGEAASLGFARLSKSRFSCSTAGAALDVFVTAFMGGLLGAFFLGTGYPHAVAALVLYQPTVFSAMRHC